MEQPSRWIEKRGLQHRVYYRTPLPQKPKNRDNVVLYAETDDRGFITLAGQLGRGIPSTAP